MTGGGGLPRRRQHESFSIYFGSRNSSVRVFNSLRVGFCDEWKRAFKTRILHMYILNIE